MSEKNSEFSNSEKLAEISLSSLTSNFYHFLALTKHFNSKIFSDIFTLFWSVFWHFSLRLKRNFLTVNVNQSKTKLWHHFENLPYCHEIWSTFCDHFWAMDYNFLVVYILFFCLISFLKKKSFISDWFL